MMSHDAVTCGRTVSAILKIINLLAARIEFSLGISMELAENETFAAMKLAEKLDHPFLYFSVK